MRPSSPIQIVSVLGTSPRAGTTTTAVHLARGLARAGQRVLLVDLNGRADASRAFRIDASADGIGGVLYGEAPLAGGTIETDVPGLSLAPGSARLAEAEVRLAEQPAPVTRLQRVLLKARQRYDLVVIDSPLAPSLLQANAIAAADAFLIPVVPSATALQLIGTTEALLRQVWKAQGHSSPILGYVLTRVDMADVGVGAAVAQLRRRYGGKVLDCVIEEEPAALQAEPSLAVDSPLAAGYAGVAEDIVRRIEQYSAYFTQGAPDARASAEALEEVFAAYRAQLGVGDGSVAPIGMGADGTSPVTVSVVQPADGARPAAPAASEDRRPLASPEAAVRDATRLAALARTGLADGAGHEAFDRVTRLATRLVGAPTALFSVVAADRQVFASAEGLAEPWASQRGTPLSHSFCQYVVAEEAPLVVSDARAHPTLRLSPGVEEMGVAAYLGVPVREPDGAVVGSLCALDADVHRWTEDDLDALLDLRALVEAEIARIREARRLRTLAGASPSYTFVVDGAGGIAEVGPTWGDYAGRSPGETGNGWLAALDSDVSARARWQACLQDGEPFSEALRVLDADGQARHFQVTASPVKGPSGDVIEVVGTCIDLAVPSASEEALARNESLVQALFDTSAAMMGLVEVTGDDLRHVHANHASARFHGLSLAEMRGRESLASGENAAAVAAWMGACEAALEAAAPVTFEHDHPTSDGPRRLSATVTAIGRAESGHPLFAYVATDVSENREREAEAASQAAAELRRNIVDNMSHEVRTPLTAVLGCAEVLASEVEGDHAELVESIRKGGLRLLHTLDGVIELARLDAGIEPDRRCVDLAAVVVEAVEASQEAARSKGLRFSLDLPVTPAWAWTDAAEVRSAVAALAQNAVKFTRDGGVTVRVETDADGVRVAIADTGCGMPESFVARAFDPFEQYSTGFSRSHEGIGLGLTRVRYIAEALGAAYGVETEPQAGSTFWLHFPKKDV